MSNFNFLSDVSLDDTLKFSPLLPDESGALRFGPWYDMFGVVTTWDDDDIGRFTSTGSYAAFEDWGGEPYTEAEAKWDWRCAHKGPGARRLQLEDITSAYEVEDNQGHIHHIHAKSAAEAVNKVVLMEAA